ncbi:MAG: hypothetical protein WD768_13070 [Phycisphaeraceae bacterium]
MDQPNLSCDAEADRILAMYGSDAPTRIMEMLERQFLILHHRSQVALGLAGIVVTTTGFSGRLIAGTNALAQGLIIFGVGLTMLAAVVVVLGVMHLRWLTHQPGEMVRPWLLTCLAYRDKKTRFYRAGILLLMLGIALYVLAIAVMLLNPRADSLPSREEWVPQAAAQALQESPAFVAIESTLSEDRT